MQLVEVINNFRKMVDSAQNFYCTNIDFCEAFDKVSKTLSLTKFLKLWDWITAWILHWKLQLGLQIT